MRCGAVGMCITARIHLTMLTPCPSVPRNGTYIGGGISPHASRVASKSPCGFRESKLNSFGSFKLLAHPCQGIHGMVSCFLGDRRFLKSLFIFWSCGCLFQTSRQSVPRDGSYIGARCRGSSWVVGTSQRLCRFPLVNHEIMGRDIGSSRFHAHPCQGMGLTMEEYSMPIRAKGWVKR